MFSKQLLLGQLSCPRGPAGKKVVKPTRHEQPLQCSASSCCWANCHAQEALQGAFATHHLQDALAQLQVQETQTDALPRTCRPVV